ncbi:SAV_2336 N-terminal domain-related protein [Kitasatospora sp. NPDC008115]|uniref:SAV_2336 N-terminal domain-related protein n=1 Tax=Kitasatospora sp. NPDC008115 TaxID=3364022 RepID=UPI0036E76DE8
MASSAQESLRAALTRLLVPADGGPPTADDLADVLWIAGLAGLAGLGASAASEQPPSEQPPSEQPPSEQPSPAGEPTGPDDRPEPPAAERPPPPADRPPHPVGFGPPPERPSAGPRAALHALGGGHGPGGVGAGGHTVQVTQPPALGDPLALARALRPLRRLTDAPGEPLLDEEATAEATAETGILFPVRRPARQLHFSVDLLVDTGATMAVWHRLGSELSALLERHGAFADVRGWALGTDTEVPTLAPLRRSHRRRPAASPVARAGWERPLKDPTGRRILLVLTDGVGPAWYGGELPAFLAASAAVRPTAALQVLPRRLWHRTGLRTAPVEARASGAGRPVPAFRSEAALPGVPRGARGAARRARVRWLPVLEVDADWLAPWAGLTAGRTSGWTPILAAPLDAELRPQRPAGPAEDPATPAERVARFRAGGSPTAYRLACHLSAAPLSLPVMRLVQRATVPESVQTDLAELFVSGLLEPRGEAAGDPDEQVYDFRPGVREELLAELTRTESVHVLVDVLAKVSGRVAATFGGTLDFRALATPAGGGAALEERSLPFAEVAVAVLAGAGGRHAEVAARLTEALERAPRGEAAAPGPGPHRWELLTPVPPVQSPPDPPAMIGRRHELATLAAAFSPTRDTGRPAVVVLAGARGMGRRRLVQEYVRAHGGRHPFVHWIDARRPGSVSQGLERLWQALAPSGAVFDEASLDPLWERLARHRDWLVVLDGVPRGTWTSDARLPFFLPRLGRGCVIVTTESVGAWQHRAAVIVPVRTLGEDELRQELTERLGRSHDPGDHRQDRALRRLARRLPRIPSELAARDLDAELAAALAESDTAADEWNTVSGGVTVGSVIQGSTINVHMPLRAPMTSLPARSGAFTGREAELDELIRFLTPVEPGTRPYRSALVSGMPGVGKSELVVQAAGEALERGWYPGGVLYLDLAGNRTDSGLTTGPALEMLLRALGADPSEVAADLQDRIARYRSSLVSHARSAGPVLVVLDNAADAAQVSPLLPVDGFVTALVTSRSTLPLDARLFDVGVLSADASLRLLENRLRWLRGNDTRITGAPDQAEALAGLCGGLPLALTICARLLADAPTRPLRSLVERLSDPRVRLDRLSRQDQSVRAALGASYRRLPEDQARLFRLLSVFPHPDVTTEAAARLADLDVPATEDLLAELALTHLVDAAPTWGHWSVHPLVTLYAVGLRTEHADNQDHAFERLLAHYCSTAEAAVHHLDHGFTGRFHGAEEIVAWLEAERPVLFPLVRFAAFTLATPLTTLLTRVRRFDDLAVVADTMLDILRRDDNRDDEAWFLAHLRRELDGVRPWSDDVPEDQRAAFDRLVRLGDETRTAEALHVSLHLAGADAGPGRQMVAEVLRDLVGDLAAADLGTGLRFTISDSPDPLRTAAAIVMELWQRLRARPPVRRSLGLAIFSGPHRDQAPGARELTARLEDMLYSPNMPIAALVISRSVMETVRRRIGAATTVFTPVADGEAYLFTGGVRLLLMGLARSAAGSADGPRPGPDGPTDVSGV